MVNAPEDDNSHINNHGPWPTKLKLSQQLKNSVHNFRIWGVFPTAAAMNLQVARTPMRPLGWWNLVPPGVGPWFLWGSCPEVGSHQSSASMLRRHVSRIFFRCWVQWSQLDRETKAVATCLGFHLEKSINQPIGLIIICWSVRCFHLLGLWSFCLSSFVAYPSVGNYLVLSIIDHLY